MHSSSKPVKEKGKQPLKGKFKKPLKDKGKQQLKKEEDNHEEEREFELIHIDNDEENETRIMNSLLQDQNAQIKDLEAKLERSKDLIHFLQVQNK